MNSVYIGYDRRETEAFAVAALSLRAQTQENYPIRGIVLDVVREQGLYTRPTTVKQTIDGPLLIDELSRRDDYDGAMSTEFAISRFLTLELAKRECCKRDRRTTPDGWALFTDVDVMYRADVAELFAILERDREHALMCVQHAYTPKAGLKMDGQKQAAYPRKNWSSVMAFRLDHPANAALTIEVVNSWRGADLHAFKWLDDDLIGALPPEWNVLVGEQQPNVEPKLVHYTRGTPAMTGHEDAPFADEWKFWRNRWAERSAWAA